MSFCTNCGAKIPDGAAFCPSCGSKVAAPAQSQPAAEPAPQTEPQPAPQPAPAPVAQPTPQPASAPVAQPAPQPAPQPVQDEPNREANGAGIAAFVLAIIGFTLTVSGIISIILGGIALGKCRRAEKANRQPGMTLRKVAKPFAVLDIVFGIIGIIGWIVYGIILLIPIIMGAIEAAGGAMDYLRIFF